MEEKLNKNELKLHKNELWLREQMAIGKSSKDISKALGVSYRLVELYLRQYDIPHESMQP